jgi:biotin carboxylase
VKPVDSRGSRGVQRLLPGLDPYLAFERALEQSASGRVMVEAYLDGPQISTESLVLGGHAHTPGFADRNYEYLDRYAPFCIENGGDLPTTLSARDQDAIRALVDQTAASIGVTDGMLKGDIVLHRGKPYVIEVATRLSGGYLCTLEIPLNTGVDFVGAVTRWALGEPVDPQSLIPKRQTYVCQRYAFLEPGLVTAVSGIDQALQRPGIAEIVLYVEPGDIIKTPTDTTARAAMAIAAGASRAEAEANAWAALSALKIETVPLDTASTRRLKRAGS